MARERLLATCSTIRFELSAGRLLVGSRFKMGRSSTCECMLSIPEGPMSEHETRQVPKAAPGRFDCEGDEVARQFFSADDLRMSPEEYAARHAHEWGLFPLHFFRFRDPELAAWVRRFAEIFSSAKEPED